jgi:hypothetical protein
VAAGDEAAHGHQVALGQGLLHFDAHVGEGVAEAAVEFLEPGRAAHGVALGVFQAVGDGVRRQQAVDGGLAALVPDLLEPLVHHSLVVAHVRSRIRAVCTAPTFGGYAQHGNGRRLTNR